MLSTLSWGRWAGVRLPRARIRKVFEKREFGYRPCSDLVRTLDRRQGYRSWSKITVVDLRCKELFDVSKRSVSLHLRELVDDPLLRLTTLSLFLSNSMLSSA